ncbi:MAG: DUF2501 domain-containing protein [Rhodopila sp.]|jgi:hypothetical protein
MYAQKFGIKPSASKTAVVGVAALGVFALSLTQVAPARAQLMDQLKGAVGSGEGGGGALGGLGGGVPSVEHASPGNTAGVLQYCIKNNYVGGASASSVKDSIVSKVTGSGQGTRDSGFQSGNNGLLQTGNGQSFSLGGSGAKEQVTRKVCDLVLQHAKSLL